MAGDTTITLTESEKETVVEALQVLLATLGRDDADQIAEVQGLLARLAD